MANGPGGVFPPSSNKGNPDKSMQSPHTPGKYSAGQRDQGEQRGQAKHVDNERAVELLKPPKSR